MALWWKKYSLPPSPLMNPKPFSARNVLIVPVIHPLCLSSLISQRTSARLMPRPQDDVTVYRIGPISWLAARVSTSLRGRLGARWFPEGLNRDAFVPHLENVELLLTPWCVK